MKQLFVFFFYFSLLTVYTATATTAGIDGDLPKDSLYVLQASVQDMYSWSEKDQKYSLQNSRFDFKILVESESAQTSNLVDKGSITDTPKKAVRYLSVYSTKEVHFELLDVAVAKKMVVKSNLSDNKERLSVYFSEQSKNDILTGMLSVSSVKQFASQESQISSSDYNCQMNNKQLVCSINYVLRKVPDNSKSTNPIDI